MRYKVLILLLSLALQANASDIRATFDYKSFYVPGKGNMLECYFNFEGNSVVFSNTEDNYKQAQIESVLILKQFSDIIDFQKSVVKSPEVKGDMIIDFYDQKRLMAPDGKYTLEVTLKDLNNPKAGEIFHEIPIELKSSNKTAFFSDIQLVAGYSEAVENSDWAKSGYDIIPFLSSHFDSDFKELIFYSELYNSHKSLPEDEEFLLSYFVEDVNTEEVIENIIQRKRAKATSVIPVFSKLDISNLRTGKFNLVVEMRNKSNEVVAIEKRVFSRNNPVMRNEQKTVEDIESTFVQHFIYKDSLIEHIYSLTPIASNLERNTIENYIEGHTLLNLKTFFYNFWLERDALNPEQAWLDYKAEVDIVDDYFATRFKKGWQTDRGNIYLKYGPPNTVVDKTREEGAYPYYIWHYYKAGTFNNGKFVFYNRDLGRDEFELLHSNVRGERRNSKWNLVLHSRNTPDVEFFRGNTTPDGNSGQDAEDMFTNPW